MGTDYLSVLSRIDATVDIRGERMELNSLGKGLGICVGNIPTWDIPTHISII